jgi:Carboxypeptidase regulatory-like domain/TonB dependent receptor
MKEETKMKSKLTLLSCVIVFVLTILMAPVSLRSQELRGKITGRVMDPNGAAVAGASVKVIDVARNSTVSLTSNSDGLFDAPYLQPGKYQVLVEVTGFKKQLQDNVIVEINQTRTLNISLEVGVTQETVTVTAEAATLNQADANLGQTIDTKRVAELPMVHGDPYTLIGLSPGIAYIGSNRLDRPFEPTHIANFAMGGARGIRSDLLVDGAPSTATANANEVIATYVPPSDIVSEFKVQTTTYDAQFGNTEGGVTSMAIKSGTNALHGTAYYWIEPGGWAANDFFGNSRGQGRPFSFSNRPGFNISGPVYIPKVYNGKNKTFFLFSYESINDSRPRFDASNIWVPTAALANGDFSAFKPANCASPTSTQICIFDPLTGTFAGGTVTNRTPFTNNQIPASRINPVAKAMLPFFGQPKNPGLLGNINDSQLTETMKPPYRNYTYRLDQNFGDKDRLFGRYSSYNRSSTYNNYTGTDYVGDRFFFISKQAVVDEVHTFNANTVLNVRYGYNRFIRATDAPEGQYGIDLTTLGFPASYNNLVPEAIRRIPRFDFNCTSCTGAALGNGHTNEDRPVDSHFATAIVNRTQGAHAFRFGGEMRIYREDDNFKSNNQTGQFIFDNTYTRVGSASSADVTGLQGFADFLLGFPTTMQIVRAADYSEYSKTWGFFGQDDWRVNKKLTVNLGLRWEFETPLTERQNKSVSGFDLSYTQPIEAAAQANFAALTDTILKTTFGLTQISAKGGLLFAGKDTGKGLYNTPKNGLLPRLGLAYQWNDKTVFRGGFGLYQGFLGERRGDVLQTGYTQTSTTPLTTLPNGGPLPVSLSTPFLGATILEPTGNSLGKQTALGQAIAFFNQNPDVSKQARWSVGFQRELPWGWTFEGVYVGDYGYNIEITRNINALPLQFLSTDSSRTTAMNTNNTNLSGTVANPFRGGLIPNASSTIARSSLLIPFPDFGTINTTNNDGKSWYNSGQFSLQKRFSKGYGLQFAYTRSKWTQQTEYLNAADAKPTKMISDQDAPNRFSMSAFYEFPFGKGQRFGSNANKFVNAVIGGWQIEGTYAYQSGFPVAFGSDAFYLGGPISIPKSQQTVSHWFNTSAFVNVLGATLPTCQSAPTGSANCATPVNHVRTLPLRFADVRTDPINNADLGLRKDIRVNETMKVQLRMEFLNAFNHPLLNGLALMPVVNPSSATFGQTTASNQQNYARRAQLSAKFIF